MAPGAPAVLLIGCVRPEGADAPGGRLFSDDVADREQVGPLEAADAVEQVNRMSPQPDLVMITGDLVEQPGPATYGNFHRLIEPLRAPTYIIPGNHDNPAILRECFGDTRLFPVVDETYQYSIEGYPFRVLALNSHYDDSELPFFGPRRMAWLEKALQESDQPTLIAIHHPPMRTGIEFIDMVGAQWYAGISRLMAEHP